MTKPASTDWIIIANEDVEGQHIQYHCLKSGDSVKSLAMSVKRVYGKALILVNTEDSYTLSPEFVEEVTFLPIAVIKKSDGEIFKEFLETHEDVLGRLDKESMTSQVPEGVPIHTDSEDDSFVSDSQGMGCGVQLSIT